VNNIGGHEIRYVGNHKLLIKATTITKPFTSSITKEIINSQEKFYPETIA